MQKIKRTLFQSQSFIYKDTIKHWSGPVHACDIIGVIVLLRDTILAELKLSDRFDPMILG